MCWLPQAAQPTPTLKARPPFSPKQTPTTHSAVHSAALFAAAAQSPDDGQVEVFDMRIVPSTGLMYVSRTPLLRAAASLSSAGAAQEAPGQRAAVTDSSGSSDAHQQQPHTTSSSSSRAGSMDKAGGLSHTAWREVHSVEAYPMTAIGYIESNITNSIRPRCSGSLIGPHAVVTAAVRAAACCLLRD